MASRRLAVPPGGENLPEGEFEYKRALSARTVRMIALGGAIGTGLFFGSGGAIQQCALLALVVVLLAFTADGRTSLVAGAIWFVLMSKGYLLVQRRRRREVERCNSAALHFSFPS